MKHLIGLVILTGWLGTALAQSKTISATNANQLNARIANKDTIYIVNYWSTTCIPCLRELPYFERIQEKYKHKNVKVILLSFDFPEDYPARLTNWVDKKQLKSEVLWFEEQKPNSYIPKLNPDWEGSLPATNIIYGNKQVRWFKEGILTEKELENKVTELLK